MGVLPDRLRLFDRLTGAQLLYYSGVLRGLDARTVRERSADLIAAFGLEDARRPARRRLLGRHDQEDRARVRHDPLAAAARARRAVRVGRPGLGGEPHRDPRALRRGRRHRRALEPRHGPHRAGLRLRGDHRRRTGARIGHRSTRCVQGRPSRTGSSSSPAGARLRRAWSGCTVSPTEAAPARRTSSVAAPGRSSASSSASSTGSASRRCCSSALVGLRFVDDVSFVRDVLDRGGRCDRGRGSSCSRSSSAVDDTMDPRRFAFFGLPDRTLALGLAVAAIVGVPALVLAIVLLGTVVTWSRGVRRDDARDPRGRARVRDLPARSPESPRRSPRFLLATRRAREVMRRASACCSSCMAAPLHRGADHARLGELRTRPARRHRRRARLDPARRRVRRARRRRSRAVGRGRPQAPHRRGAPLVPALDGLAGARRADAGDARPRGVGESYRGLGWFDRMPHGADRRDRRAQHHLLVPRRALLGLAHHGPDRAAARR